jgi:hypothetical protein
MTNDCEACQLLDYCECPEPPTHRELYETELGCELREWRERANAPGFAVRIWLERWYGRMERVHEASVRASPLMSIFR